MMDEKDALSSDVAQALPVSTTHDELLARLYEYKSSNQGLFEMTDLYQWREALRAVVELHKDNGYGSCDICADPHTGHLGVMASYPCPTIQKIMDELK